MFLHWDGSCVTYQKFLSYLRSHLDKECNTIIRYNDELTIGSDDEKALVKALKICFPSAKHLLCMVHLEENTRRLLVDKLGTEKKKREEVLKEVFRTRPQADDSILFSRQAEEIESKYEAAVPAFVDYFRKRLRPAIEKHVIAKNSNATICWTNNNCESMNHILKLSCDWKPQRLPELIRRLESVVRGQMQEVRRALHGQGEFVLAPAYAKLGMSDMLWKQLSDQEKLEQVALLYTKRPKASRTNEDIVVSNDGKLKVPCGQRLAKKPGQRKRPRNAKTTSKQH